MAESISIPKNSPTAEDTVRNRYIEFLVYCVIEFNQKAYLTILVSSDKENAQTSKFSDYLNKGVVGGLTIPFGNGIGKVSGETIGGLVKQYEISKEHKKSKLAEHLLNGFEPDDPKWISLKCFSCKTSSKRQS